MINWVPVSTQYSDAQPCWANLNPRTTTLSRYLAKLNVFSFLDPAQLCRWNWAGAIRRQQGWEKESSRARMDNSSEPGLLLLYKPVGCGLDWKGWRKWQLLLGWWSWCPGSPMHPNSAITGGSSSSLGFQGLGKQSKIDSYCAGQSSLPP